VNGGARDLHVKSRKRGTACRAPTVTGIKPIVKLYG
jgi:hypothetical protein